VRQSYDRCTMSIDPADPIYALRQQLASEIVRSLGGSDVAASYYGNSAAAWRQAKFRRAHSKSGFIAEFRESANGGRAPGHGIAGGDPPTVRCAERNGGSG
jgi:hypothetical protein